MFYDFIANQVHNDFSHATGRSISRTLEDDILHFAATEVLYALFTQNPGDGVSDVAFAATIWSDDGGDPISGEDYLCVVGEGFKTGNFQALKFEHALGCSVLRPASRPETSVRGDACTGGQYKCQPLRMSTR